LEKNEVLRALSAVKDPDSGKDILSSGQVRSVNVETGGVQVILSIVNPTPERLERFRESVTQELARISQGGRVQVDFAPAASEQHLSQTNPSKVGHVVALASGKGGVGKSTVSIYLATSLARMGLSVGLLDADIYGASAHLMLGPESKLEARGNMLIPPRIQGVKIMSMGYFSGTETPVIWRGPLVGKAVRDFITLTDWGELDFLVVDLPPGTGDAALTLAQSLKLDGVILVTTPQEAAAQVAAKSFYMFKRLGIPVLGVVENMSYFVCPKCGEKTEIFGSGGGERTSERAGVQLLAKVPLAPELTYSSDMGEPLTPEQSNVVSEFDRLAKSVLSRLQADKDSAAVL
jgi:ATP-binding protein involved in chromosome partitioning